MKGMNTSQAQSFDSCQRSGKETQIWLVWNLRPLAQKSNYLALEQQLSIIMIAVLFLKT
jgi:hypothetical protein